MNSHHGRRVHTDVPVLGVGKNAEIEPVVRLDDK